MLANFCCCLNNVLFSFPLTASGIKLRSILKSGKKTVDRWQSLEE